MRSSWELWRTQDVKPFYETHITGVFGCLSAVEQYKQEREGERELDVVHRARYELVEQTPDQRWQKAVSGEPAGATQQAV